ncbi:hypothetical protein VP01_5498g1 [Puccinia sorghi]|uniref:Uncharacterized protein n=1 Tax=Puccinia sorghi TaxID=27349 RepID=A0A0L6UK63_9BASI|nr:hypothetical protein VP01_5498g1 [Puccinia sorghi]
MKLTSSKLQACKNSLSFAPCGAKIDHYVQIHWGVLTSIIGGALYLKMGSVLPPDSLQVSMFSQISVTGGNDIDQEACMHAAQAQSTLNVKILFSIQQFMFKQNKLCVILQDDWLK